MKTNLSTWILALALGLGFGGSLTQAAGAPFFQDREHDYSKSKSYQQGMRDGRSDQARKMDHSKKRHYKKEEDRRAYEAGYQNGRGH